MGKQNPRGEGRQCGRVATYNHGCHCPQCRDEAARKMRRSRQHRWERAGTPRPYRCHCGDSFPSPGGLTSHRTRVHGYYF